MISYTGLIVGFSCVGEVASPAVLYSELPLGVGDGSSGPTSTEACSCGLLLADLLLVTKTAAAIATPTSTKTPGTKGRNRRHLLPQCAAFTGVQLGSLWRSDANVAVPSERGTVHKRRSPPSSQLLDPLKVTSRPMRSSPMMPCLFTFSQG